MRPGGCIKALDDRINACALYKASTFDLSYSSVLCLRNLCDSIIGVCGTFVVHCLDGMIFCVRMEGRFSEATVLVTQPS